MTNTRRTSIGPVLLLCALGALAFGASGALALGGYQKPAGGKWQIQDLFDQTAGGKLKVAANGKQIKKLKLKVGADHIESCGAKQLKLKGKLKVRHFKSSDRWAVGRQSRGSTLIEPTKAKFKLGTKTVKGKAIMLFDIAGRLATTARVELDGCTLGFNARKN